VPNEVYRQTRQRLADLVSTKAAERVLDDAMRRRGYTEDSISSRQMSRMLKGPVLQELESILPRAGLKHKLREIGLDLEASSTPSPRNATKVPSADVIAPLPTPEPSIVQTRGVTNPSFELELDDDRPSWQPTEVITAPPAGAAARYQADLFSSDDVLLDEGSVRRLPDPGSGTHAVADDRPARGRVVAEAGRAAMVLVEAEPLPSEQLKAAVVRFAKIDSVQQVAALRSDGEVVEARGGAVDLSSLGLLIISVLGLLRRHGAVRSYYLRLDTGQLFLFPFGPDTIVVVGRSNLNLGAVFTALAALEEEL
jgi:hypothetical protein